MGKDPIAQHRSQEARLDAASNFSFILRAVIRRVRCADSTRTMPSATCAIAIAAFDSATGSPTTIEYSNCERIPARYECNDAVRNLVLRLFPAGGTSHRLARTRVASLPQPAATLFNRIRQFPNRATPCVWHKPADTLPQVRCRRRSPGTMLRRLASRDSAHPSPAPPR